MFHDSSIIQQNTIWKCNSFGEFFECKLCNMEIIGIDQLKKHLAGKKHTRNKEKENRVIPMFNSTFEGEPVEGITGELEDVEISTNSSTVVGNDIPVPAKLWNPRDCASCMGKMNSMLEKLCGYEPFEA